MKIIDEKERYDQGVLQWDEVIAKYNNDIKNADN